MFHIVSWINLNVVYCSQNCARTLTRCCDVTSTEDRATVVCIGLITYCSEQEIHVS